MSGDDGPEVALCKLLIRFQELNNREPYDDHKFEVLMGVCVAMREGRELTMDQREHLTHMLDLFRTKFVGDQQMSVHLKILEGCHTSNSPPVREAA